MEIIDEAKNIVLIGLMGSGKSAIGRTIAKKLGRRFIDTDRFIERKFGKTVAEVFDQSGESTFRALEKEIIKKVSQYIGIVIATGGGVIKDLENFKYLKQSGWIIALYASPDTLYKRIAGKRIRPLLLNQEDPVKKLEEISNERKIMYAQADFQVDTENKEINDIADEIIGLLETNRQASGFDAGI
ncbi:MAG: shikimate kinase [Candidatus Melainabacteria bacterium]|nr:shikimate kinase [Candidatus Melainabacteria bacterium]